jgi:hypothetical protein
MSKEVNVSGTTLQVMGIDPGKSGGAVVVNHHNIVDALKFPTATEHDIADWLRMWSLSDDPPVAYLEKVHSMPKQGVASSFKFGESFGFLKGLLTGLHIRYELVTPQTWQRAMKCLTKGDKNVSKAAAQRLWPSVKFTHAIADAALIGEYGRRIEANSIELNT